MKKTFTAILFALLSLALSAQPLQLKVSEDVPEAAREVLLQRFTQMLENGVFSLTDEASSPVIIVSVEEKERMETSGTAVVLDVTAEVKDVATTFTVKGLGSDADDAYLRAAKQILPQSKAAKVFLSAVKMVVHE